MSILREEVASGSVGLTDLRNGHEAEWAAMRRRLGALEDLASSETHLAKHQGQVAALDVRVGEVARRLDGLADSDVALSDRLASAEQRLGAYEGRAAQGQLLAAEESNARTDAALRRLSDSLTSTTDAALATVEDRLGARIRGLAEQVGAVQARLDARRPAGVDDEAEARLQSRIDDATEALEDRLMGRFNRFNDIRSAEPHGVVSAAAAAASLSEEGSTDGTPAAAAAADVDAGALAELREAIEAIKQDFTRHLQEQVEELPMEPFFRGTDTTIDFDSLVKECERMIQQQGGLFVIV